jgi:hypothetical protein
MARIYDNIETKFADGLNDILTNAGVKRADFCVGYFNLRWWKLVTNQINQLQGEDIYEDDEKHHRICRLLIGMHRPPEDLVRARSYPNFYIELIFLSSKMGKSLRENAVYYDINSVTQVNDKLI